MKRINVLVNPRSKTQEVQQRKSGYLVKVKSEPKEGKANKELVEIVADYFGLHKNQVVIVSGFKSRRKIVEIKY